MLSGPMRVRLDRLRPYLFGEFSDGEDVDQDEPSKGSNGSSSYDESGFDNAHITQDARPSTQFTHFGRSNESKSRHGEDRVLSPANHAHLPRSSSPKDVPSLTPPVPQAPPQLQLLWQ